VYLQFEDGPSVRVRSEPAGFQLTPIGTPNAAVLHGRALLKHWQQELLTAWKHALPTPGCVVSIGAESHADVTAKLNSAAASLQSSLVVDQRVTRLAPSGPVWETKLCVIESDGKARPVNDDESTIAVSFGPPDGRSKDFNAPEVPLPPGLIPEASPHSDDPLTLIGDILAGGPPQPYRPPVPIVARKILALLHSSSED
jgi:hypothetical protein